MSPYYDTEHQLVPKNTEDRQKAMFLNLAPLLNLMTGVLGTVATVVLWAMFKNRSQYLDKVGKESINFQINILAVGAIFGILGAIINVIPILGQLVSFVIFIVLSVALFITYILNIVAAVRASEGRTFKYPSVFRFLK